MPLMATTMLASALLHAPATTVRAPSPLMVSGLFNRRSPAPPPLPPPPPPVAPAEQAALRAAAGAWLASTPFALSSARGIVTDVFGLPTSTFEDNLREPAAGLLEITAPLFPLEATTLSLLNWNSTCMHLEDSFLPLSKTVAGLFNIQKAPPDPSNKLFSAGCIDLFVAPPRRRRFCWQSHQPCALRQTERVAVEPSRASRRSRSSTSAQVLFSLARPIVPTCHTPILPLHHRHSFSDVFLLSLTPFSPYVTPRSSYTPLAFFRRSCFSITRPLFSPYVTLAIFPISRHLFSAVGRSQTNTSAAFLLGFAVGCVYLFQTLRKPSQ